jgi:hypothetical protein
VAQPAVVAEVVAEAAEVVEAVVVVGEAAAE